MAGQTLLQIGRSPQRYVVVVLHWTQFMVGVALWKVRGSEGRIYDSWNLMLGPIQIEYAVEYSTMSVYLIAELGSCHDGDWGKVERLLSLCAHAGFSACKLQYWSLYLRQDLP